MNTKKDKIISKKRHYVYNLITSYGNTIIASIISFISVPIALNYWGNELYGVWTILMSFSTYIAASGLGIDSATGFLMTKNPNLEEKVSILKKGIKLLICCSLFSFLILSILTIIIPDWFRIIGKMDESNYPIAKIAACIFISGIIINLPLSAVSTSLASFEKAYYGTLVNTVQNILSFITILITVKLKLSLPFYVLLFSLINIFGNLVRFFIVLYTIKIKRKSSNDLLKHEISEDNSYKNILKMGINMSLYGTALLLVPNLSNLVISNNIDVKSLVPYSLSYKLFIVVVGFIQNVTNSMTPLLGAEYGKSNWEWIKINYKKLFHVFVPLTIFGLLGVVWLSKPFIYIWTGDIKNYAGDLISILLSIYFLGALLSHINHIIINAFNYTNKIWIVSWSDGIIFLLSSSLLIKFIGIASVPLGLVLGTLIISSWAYPLIVYKRSNKRICYDFIYLIKNLLIFLTSVLLYLIINKLDFSFSVTILLDFSGLLFTLLCLFIILPPDFKNKVKVLKKRNFNNTKIL